MDMGGGSGSESDHQMDMLSAMMQMDHHNFTLPNMISPLPQMEPFSGAPALMYNPSNLASSSSFISPLSTSRNTMASMREMIFRIAVMQPVHIDPESVKPPKRRNVKISKDPQSVAARHRRERISEKIRILQRLVPGGTKMDTASMLDEAIHYVKFLKKQVQSLEQLGNNTHAASTATGALPFGAGNAMATFLKAPCQPPVSSHMLAGGMHQQVLRS